MNHQGENFRRVLTGKPVEVPPALAWKHFYYDDAWKLARATVDFYRDHRVAAAKIMPDVPILFPDLSLTSANQLKHLRNVSDLGRADEYVETVRHTRELLDDSDVLLVTVFSPLALVGMWGGPSLIEDFASTDRPAAHALLSDLGDGVAALIQACTEAGADGVYYSCWGQDVVGPDVYREYGVPYDLAGLRGARTTQFRLLHLHGGEGMRPSEFAQYPVHSVGWSQLDTGVSAADYASYGLDMIPMGGMNERPAGSPAEVRREAGESLREVIRSVGCQFIASPGCSLPDDVSDETISALLAAVGDACADEA